MTFIFRDKRFFFSVVEEAIFHILSYATYVCLGAAAFILLFSDIPPLRWFGLLIFLFLADRAFQIGKGERKLWQLHGKPPVNVARAATPRTVAILHRAFRTAQATGEDIGFLILGELLKEGQMKHILLRLGTNHKEFAEKASEYGEHAPLLTRTEREAFDEIESIALAAAKNAARLRDPYIYPANLFAALFEHPSPALSKLFYLFEMDARDAESAPLFKRVGLSTRALRALRTFSFFAPAPRRERGKTMNRAWTARPTPLLDSWSEDVTALAEAGAVGFLVGHDKEYETLVSILAKPGRPNAILVGEAGAGKSTLIEHLALQMARDEAPKAFFDKRLVSLNLAELMSGADVKVISERLKRVTEEILRAGNVVLAIMNAEELFKSETARAAEPIDFLLPVIESGDIPVIAAANTREFKRLIEPRSDFLKLFEIVRIEEVTEEEAVRFLVRESLYLEREFSLPITFRAMRKSAELAKRYFRSRLLPGSALDLLKQSAAEAAKRRERTLTGELVVEVAERQSKVPIQKADAKEAEKLLNLETRIHERLVNQTEAVSAVSRALREFRSGLSRSGSPIASFLFVGPTGVGKTELAKTLAAIQFGSESLMRRFDMSEYQDKQSLYRLIGTPDGSKTGLLTDAILENPYSLVLLDEFEKAHPDILNLFLQVLDDGRLTDSSGRTADFENVIIIATSNAHSDFIKSEIERKVSPGELAESVKAKLTEVFRPELVNRFSDIVVFRPLTPAEIEEVASRMLASLCEQILSTHGIRLSIDTAAVKRIAEIGYSPVFGSRPLRQAISENIRGALAEKLLKKEIGRGNSLRVTYAQNGFAWTVVE
jgi:ATP-dependent Clp protease ATP-binding subunit ClpC